MATLDRIGAWKTESEDLRRSHDHRWARSLKLVKGIFQSGENVHSNVRGRSKIFFRKIWATSWRLVAAFYQAFLRDPDTFKIQGRDSFDDQVIAKVLQFIVQYRHDQMMRTQSQFQKLIWAFQNIVNLGYTVGKFSWESNKNLRKDAPIFRLYANEQVFPDIAAETPEEMRYIIFQNYMTMEDMEGLGYDIPDDLEPVSLNSNIVRQTRFMGGSDPLQNPQEKEYPRPGSIEDDEKSRKIKLYETWETFYRNEDNEWWFSVSHKEDSWAKEPVKSKYGDRIPAIMGSCLTEAHRLIGEGFPEPLEAPQESFNFNLNQRKDNVSLALNRQTIVSRFANVDLQSLLNNRAGSVTLADDVDGVQERVIPDVTQSAYLEGQADIEMMNNMSGVEDVISGTENTNKATVARLNFAQANAKIDLYTALVGETFMRQYWTMLTYLVQRFETNKSILRVANQQMIAELGVLETLEGFQIRPEVRFTDLTDFEADIIVDAGISSVSRGQEIQNTVLAMDRAIQSNQATANLVQTGVMRPQDAKVVDISKFYEHLLPKIGFRDAKRFFITLQAPPPELQQGGGQGGSQQAGLNPNLSEEQQLQSGGLGGV